MPDSVSITANADLTGCNTLALPAKAEFLARVNSTDGLLQLLAKPPAELSLVLGEGSNLVLQNDLSGLVIANRIGGVRYQPLSGGDVQVIAGAGERWDALVEQTVTAGLWGIENLAGIPGTVGAAPIQNIGAYGVELQRVLDWVELVELDSLSVQRLGVQDCEFGYRQSIFKQSLKGKAIITRVALRLHKHGSANLSYGDLSIQARTRGLQVIQPSHMADLVRTVRSEKLPDPHKLANAGSFFKNPIVDATQAFSLKGQYSGLPCFDAPLGQVKLAAGWLIEQAGWKGRKLGPCGMHERQALVLVNFGQATGADVLALANRVVDDVLKQFGVQLEIEPAIYPSISRQV